MDTKTIWLILIAISTPIAGFVGFAIQLRQVKKIRLENEKLQLEIALLKASASKSENQIIRPTNTEVMRYANRDIQRSIPDHDESPRQAFSRTRTLKQNAMEAAIAIGLLLMAAYFIYDIYRIFAWVCGKL